MSTITLLCIALAGVIMLLLLVIKAKVQPFVALLLVSLLVALAAGIPAGEVGKVMIAGMGGVLGSVTIIIGLGAMLGRMIEHSGGAGDWVKVPLAALGKTSGLSFRMTTTDTGDFGANTPLYFALDALTVNTAQPTAVENLPVLQEEATKIWYQGYVYILRQGTIYNLQGDNCSRF
mgnify:CR=1 FL=1